MRIYCPLVTKTKSFDWTWKGTWTYYHEPQHTDEYNPIPIHGADIALATSAENF